MNQPDDGSASPVPEQATKEGTSAEAQAAAELRYGSRVVARTILINVALTIFKLAAGILGRSAAMISDGVESAADMFTSTFVLLGFRMARKSADEGHPYGHEKIEGVVSIFMALVLVAVALMIGSGAVHSLLDPGQLAIPGAIALIAAAVTVAVKEWMYHYTLRAGRRIKSSALEADAWHHRSDGFSSIGTFVCIGGAMLGLRILDPLAALVICLLILKVAVDLTKNGLNQLVDSAAPPEVVQQIKELIAAQTDIIRVDDLKTRRAGNKLYVDVEIAVEQSLSLVEAHNIAEMLHDKIESCNSDIKHCMVHVNPLEGTSRETGEK